MKQIETLHLIRARCVELLEQAKLRSDEPEFVAYGLNYEANALFLRSCPVAFEAALESTIAAIDGTDEIMLHYSSAKHNALLHALVEEQRNDIIKAWQHLLP